MGFSRYIYKQFLKNYYKNHKKKIDSFKNIYKSNYEFKNKMDDNLQIINNEIKKDLFKFDCQLKKKIKQTTNHLYNMLKENT